MSVLFTTLALLRLVSTPVWSVKALRSPPVVPMGAWKIEISTQEAEIDVMPVQRHWPLTHAPFLLQ